MTPDEAQSLGRAIRAIRTERGLSQIKVAFTIGISVGQLRIWERGKVPAARGRAEHPPAITCDQLAALVPPPWTAPSPTSPTAPHTQSLPGSSMDSNPWARHAQSSEDASLISPTPKPTESPTSSRASPQDATSSSRGCRSQSLPFAPWAS